MRLAPASNLPASGGLPLRNPGSSKACGNDKDSCKQASGNGGFLPQRGGREITGPPRESGPFLRIKHPDRRLAVCGLLATSLLTACGGGSSSSGTAAGTGGAGSGGSYDLGYAQGTAATLALVLDDLERLQRSLAGSGTPVQTSLGRAVTIGSLNLEPRQRAQLATELEMFITQVRALQMAAAADGATRADATAAQAAADDAFRALQLVVAASTVAQAGGGEMAQDEAITALRAIADAAEEPDAADARAAIDRALNNLNTALQNQVAELERQLAAARDALGTQAGNRGTIADLTSALNAARAARDAAERKVGFAETPPPLPAIASVRTTYHPRRTGVRMVFDTSDSTMTPDDRTTSHVTYMAANTGYNDYWPIGATPQQDTRVFEPAGDFGTNLEYDVTGRGTAVTDGFDLEPDAILFNRAGRNPQVFTTTGQNTGHFPGRGTVYRGEQRYIRDRDNVSSNNNTPNQWLYHARHRLVVQGEEVEPSDNGGNSLTNANQWNSWDATPYMTFQYKPGAGFTMGFGGPGVIFPDLERYMAKGGRGPTASGRALVGSGDTDAGSIAACGAVSSDPAADNWCDDATTANVEISFGEPEADPYNQPNTSYWYRRAQSPRIAAVGPTDDPDLAQAGDQFPTHDIGRYEMILSGHAGTETSPNRRLRYAAYGLFRFINNVIHRETPYSNRVGRMQVFHYGLDAFADADGRKPSDLTGDDTLEGTFHGKTAAWVVSTNSRTQQAGHVHFIENMFRARGDIELRACIGGGATCTLQGFQRGSPPTLTANQISGKISNLEYAHQDLRDFWTSGSEGGITVQRALSTDVFLRPTTIGNDGTYKGTVESENYGIGTADGEYEGAFYGPTGAGMETAGTWRLNAAGQDERNLSFDGIIGSFGAICEGTCKAAPPSQ